MSGFLELSELRAVLIDLGLMPQTPEEKAGLRRTLVNAVLGEEDGHTDSEDDDDDSESRDREARLKRLGGEKEAAHSISVTRQDLPLVLGRIRARLKVCREQVYLDLFNHFDIFERGELDLPTVKSILKQQGLHPNTPHEQAAFKELTTFLRQRRVNAMRVAAASARTGADRAVQARGTFMVAEKGGCEAEGEDAEPGIRKSFRRQGGEGTDFLLSTPFRPSPSPSGSDLGMVLQKSPKPPKPKGLTPEARTRRELQSDTAGRFSFYDFQILMEFIRENREKSIAEEQRKLAESLGLLSENGASWVSSKLFLEFRHELKKCHEIFVRFDEDFSGYLEVNEIWEALMSLGLMPKLHHDKVAILHIISEACENTLRSELRSKRRFGGMGLALMYLYTQEETLMGREDLSDSYNNIQMTWLQNQMAANQRINFKDFLGLLSKVRAWHTQSMREELMPLFEKHLKRRVAPGAAISIPVVCKALEDLKLAPNSREEQVKIQELLEQANEWGFDPPCLNFEEFIKYVRQMREWTYGVQRATENEYAWNNLEFDERKVNMFRMAFDVLDTKGTNHLDIAAVRKVFVLLRRAITSDGLRELFAKIDCDGSGTVDFLEFLHLVNELDQGSWGYDVPPLPSPRMSQLPSPAPEELQQTETPIAGLQRLLSVEIEGELQDPPTEEMTIKDLDELAARPVDDELVRMSTEHICASRIDD